jgi:type IX secretion system PorP/SprF family membrane protein
VEWIYNSEKILVLIERYCIKDMMRRRNIILVLILTAGLKISGQTTADQTRISLAYPVFSQYLHNGLLINPAYAGSRDVLSFFLSGREQWAGLKGAPTLETISVHTLLKNDRVGLGLSGQFMQFGITTQTSLYADYAYHVWVGKGRLAFGLKAGADISNTSFTIDFRNSLTGSNGANPVTDPVFESDNKFVLPNAGAGLYFYGRKFFAGAAVPAFLGYFRNSDGKTSFKAFSDMDILATAGALVDLAPSFKFKPSVFIDYSVTGIRKNQIDLNGNLIIKDMIWIGGSWRTSEKVAVAILQVQINPQLMIGYSYDYPFGAMSNYFKASHEIVIRYEFSYKVNATNPRYF